MRTPLNFKHLAIYLILRAHTSAEWLTYTMLAEVVPVGMVT